MIYRGLFLSRLRQCLIFISKNNLLALIPLLRDMILNHKSKKKKIHWQKCLVNCTSIKPYQEESKTILATSIWLQVSSLNSVVKFLILIISNLFESQTTENENNDEKNKQCNNPRKQTLPYLRQFAYEPFAATAAVVTHRCCFVFPYLAVMYCQEILLTNRRRPTATLL